MGGRISKPINKDKYTFDDTELVKKNMANSNVSAKQKAGMGLLLMMQNRNPALKKVGADYLFGARKRGLLDDSTVTMSSNNKKTTLG